LDVTYAAPLSDGGSDILNYRVELDVTNRFLNPIHTTIPCSTANIHTVYEIRTEGAVDDPIVSGYYTLTITRNRIGFTTDMIPYDAVAMETQESGTSTRVEGITIALQNGHSTLTTKLNISSLVIVFNLVTVINDSHKNSLLLYPLVVVALS